jgi:serine/threonine protein kinase
MATVFLAVQTSLQRKVAIKVMRRAGADENFEQRFLIEGRAMAKLPHRNIVGVFDIVQTAEINYIAMEYLAGGTLVEHLRQGLSLARRSRWWCRSPTRCSWRTTTASCTATSSPPTSCSATPTRRCSRDFGIAAAPGSSSPRA